MNIFSGEKPACWDRLVEVFGVTWKPGLCVTYGSVIHHCGPVSSDMIVHELVHVEQQKGMKPEEYLDRYISDEKFRNRVEFDAFEAQATFILITTKNLSMLSMQIDNVVSQMRNHSGARFSEDQIKAIEGYKI